MHFRKEGYGEEDLRLQMHPEEGEVVGRLRVGGGYLVKSCIVLFRKGDYEDQLGHLFKVDDKNWQVPGQRFQKWSTLKIAKLGMHLGKCSGHLVL